VIAPTTLAMIVRTVDQSTVPLTNIQNKVTQVTRASDNSSRSLGGLARVGSRVSSALGSSGLARALGSVNALLGVGGLVGLAGIAGVALAGLAGKIKDAVEESKRIKEVSERLELPVDKVKAYGDEWEKVALKINDAARGFGEFSNAQSRAFSALGVNQFAPGAQDKALTQVAAASGSRQTKVDVLRILFGLSSDEAAKELDRELERLAQRTSTATNRRTTVAEAEGVQFGAMDIDQLRRTYAIATDLELKRQQEARKELEEVERARVEGRKDALKDIEEAEKEALKKRLEAFEAESREAQAAYQVELAGREEINAAIEDGMRQAADAAADMLDQTLDSLSAIGDSIRVQQGPQQMFTGARAALDSYIADVEDISARAAEATSGWLHGFEDALVEVVRTGKLSFRDLAESIILDLARIQARAAAVGLGKALLGGGGGALGFIGGLFGGNAGGGTASGVRVVGEEGPEVVAGGINTFKVFNQRQSAFAGGAQSPGGINLTYSPIYTISGVETQQVVAYVERSREQDQKGILKMLHDNGFGRMR
jgi:lambda family phage tail tape measure protein